MSYSLIIYRGCSCEEYLAPISSFHGVNILVLIKKIKHLKAIFYIPYKNQIKPRQPQQNGKKAFCLNSLKQKSVQLNELSGLHMGFVCARESLEKPVKTMEGRDKRNFSLGTRTMLYCHHIMIAMFV